MTSQTFQTPAFFAKLSQLLETGDFSDVSVTIGSTTKRLHSWVLALHSEYFQRIFSLDMAEQQSRTVTIDNTDLEPVFDSVVSFLYTGTLRVNSRDSFALLLAADYFDIPIMREHLFQFFERAENAPSLLLEALDKKQDHLVDRFLEAIAKSFGPNLQSPAQGPIVRSLPVAMVERLVAHEALNVLHEDELFDFLLRYSQEHSLALEDSQHLFRHVRFPLLSHAALHRALDLPCVPRNALAAGLLERVDRLENPAVATSLPTQPRASMQLAAYGPHIFTQEDITSQCDFIDLNLLLNSDLTARALHFDSGRTGQWVRYICREPRAFTCLRMHTTSRSDVLFDIEQSDDGEEWTAVAQHRQDVGWTTTHWTSVGPHTYWRIHVVEHPGTPPWYNFVEWRLTLPPELRGFEVPERPEA